MATVITLDGRHPLTGRYMKEDDVLSDDDLWALHERGVVVGDYDSETVARYLRRHVQRSNASHVARFKALEGRTCVWCAKLLPNLPARRRGPVPKHCSNRCRQAEYRSRRDRA